MLPCAARLSDAVDPDHPHFYLDNLDNDGVIQGSLSLTEDPALSDKDIARIRPQTFVLATDMTVPPPPANWLLKNKFSPFETVQTTAINNPDNLDFVEVRINDVVQQGGQYIEEPGVFSFGTDALGASSHTVYLSNYLHGTGAQGVLDIYQDQAQDTAPADTGIEYEIILKRN